MQEAWGLEAGATEQVEIDGSREQRGSGEGLSRFGSWNMCAQRWTLAYRYELKWSECAGVWSWTLKPI